MTDHLGSVPPGTRHGFWDQFRRTFGPALVGLLAAPATAAVACTSFAVLLVNVSNTYTQFPGLEAPALAVPVAPPTAVLWALAALGAVALVGIGLIVARVARPANHWEGVSAGLSAALTATLAAYAAGIGWTATLAMVVVPAIADLTAIGNATRTPADGRGVPSDALVERYEDLRTVPADTRGGVFFAKVVADQVLGSASAPALGLGISLATAGVTVFCGTVAGGWMLRRGESFRATAIPYIELTGAPALALGRLVSGVVGLGPPPTLIGAVCLVIATGFVVRGAIARWEWPFRVSAAAVWVLVLCGVGLDHGPAHAFDAIMCLVYTGAGTVLTRRWRATALLGAAQA
ncbi:hypothetical protein GobsT_62480 [Gemmata obscuriglobus]|uniref:Uncharacterized protein n=1 Tax=Gemmata obscuriglobus TaxID=114 RepID=A0A2Z3GQA3_9BACT|nr:hypothetical protein [Gemmata obscuriglobus]AWM36003.1 hypothetical protein C1280_02590 [Gemmata obscuriglobus]QEG31427.1 hypothetical protein GobsT_62480 [Gemmata obscuriglobus]VTS10768.1 unnamed protein product [Gemmata obscuriglobus UQM 2246]